MSESAMWDSLRPVMKNLHPVRIENVVSSGTPDVNYTQGWIELKYLKQWPVREGVVTIDHFTPQQRAWLLQREKAGGKAYLLLKVGAKEWLLFSGMVAAKYVGKVTRSDLLNICIQHWTQLPTTQELEKCLCN